MQAVEPPVIAAPAPAEDESAGVIEVVGTRADQVQKIDRRTYRVKDNALSAQSDGLQLIRGLPAVIITPDDQILMLGSPGVRIFVDDRPIHSDPIAYLRTLHGSDIERVEIITNPSAQYSSEGTGGIINFILRKKQDDGLSGSLSLLGSSMGNTEPSATIKKKKEKWTYELQLQGRAGRYERQRFHKLRTVTFDPDSEPTINTEDGRSSVDTGSIFANLKITRDLNERSAVSAEFWGGASGSTTKSLAIFEGLTEDFDSFFERARRRDEASFAGIGLNFDHSGKKQGEKLKATSQVFGNLFSRERINAELTDGSYSRFLGEENLFIYSDASWEHPIGSKSILSMGATWYRDHRDRTYEFDGSFADDQLGPDTFNDLRATSNTLTTYATFQRKFGTWTVMPGLRFEYRGLKIASSGYDTVRTDRAKLFPTFHVEHPLSKTVNMTVSYSKRIERPYIDFLRPFPLRTGAQFIAVGNPRLGDQTTDAYEINLTYRRKNLNAGVIIFERRTHGLWESSYSVNENGDYLQMKVNAGRQIDRGAQFDLTTPLLKRVKGTASVNLFYSRTPFDPLVSDEDFETFRYSGNATVEWHGKDGKTGRPGDIAQIQLTYESPSRSYQFKTEDYYTLNFSWTHSFSKKLSLTASLNGIGSNHYRHHLVAPFVREDYEKRETPEFKLKLVKTLGKTK
jgi:ferric enterobactin receptor